ncbi:hypothetical protein AJ87_08695 [Rhizobium yanglingense]|nr:hypothetical protein AJ87_08695 [Rhizobium yanglingense]
MALQAKKPGGFLRPGATRLVMRLELSATEVDVLAADARLLLTPPAGIFLGDRTHAGEFGAAPRL